METRAAVRKVTVAIITRAQSEAALIARSLLTASETAVPARFKPMIATTEPVTLGGIKRSIQLGPQRIVATAATAYRTAAPAAPHKAYGILEALPPVMARFGAM